MATTRLRNTLSHLSTAPAPEPAATGHGLAPWEKYVPSEECRSSVSVFRAPISARC